MSGIRWSDRHPSAPVERDLLTGKIEPPHLDGGVCDALRGNGSHPVVGFEAPHELDLRRVVEGKVQSRTHSDLEHSARGVRYHRSSLPLDVVPAAREVDHTREHVAFVEAHQGPT